MQMGRRGGAGRDWGVRLLIPRFLTRNEEFENEEFLTRKTDEKNEELTSLK